MSTLIKSPGCSRKVSQTVKTCFSGSRKNTWKRWIDLALYLVSCALWGTGLLLAYRLPHGHGEGRMVTFLGYGRHDWGTIHTWLAWVAIFLVVFHLVWNREWLVKIAASGRLARLAAGIFAGLLMEVLSWCCQSKNVIAAPGLRLSDLPLNGKSPLR